MITTINEFRKINESLSQDNERAAKIRTLIDLGRQMVENYKKAEEIAQLKAGKNAEINELLNRLNKTSVIAEGVLIEVYKPYETKRLANKEYFEFVNNAVGVIGEDFKTLSNAVKEISTKLTGGTSYIRTTKNTQDVPTGTLKANEGILSSAWNTIKEWFNAFKQSILALLPGIEDNLSQISKDVVRFEVMREGLKASENYVLEDVVNGFLKPYINEVSDYSLDSDGTKVMLYVPAKDVKFDIKDQHATEWNILQLGFQEFCSVNGLYDGDVSWTSDYSDLVLSADTDIVDMRQYPRESKVNESLLSAINQLDNFFMHKCKDKDKQFAYESDAEELLADLDASNWSDAIDTDENKVEELLNTWTDKAKECGMKTESKVNENNKDYSYGTAHLQDQNVKLGENLESTDDLIIGQEYCIVDLGVNEWNGGYKYMGYINNVHDFSDTFDNFTNASAFSFTNDEINEMIELGQIAFYGDFVNEELSPEQIEARNKYSREYKKNRREQDRNIAAVLEKAKEAIVLAKEEAYYNALADMNEKMIKNLLNEFNAKSVAIDDKILTLVKIEEKESLDMKAYEAKITNAEEVGEAVAKMAKALMAIHTKTVTVSGSVRHIGDTANLPEGTFDARFDHETKTVIPPTNEGVVSFLSKVWNKVKGFFASFKSASKQADTALAAI